MQHSSLNQFGKKLQSMGKYEVESTRSLIRNTCKVSHISMKYYRLGILRYSVFNRIGKVLRSIGEDEAESADNFIEAWISISKTFTVSVAFIW